MLKRIMAMMMVMVMMTMFGSVTANAAKRDELEVYDIIVRDGDYISPKYGVKESTVVITRVTLELDDGMEYPVINSELLTRAYARYKGVDDILITSKLVLVEDSKTGHDIGWRFMYAAKENGKLVVKTMNISNIDELCTEKYLTDICVYL